MICAAMAVGMEGIMVTGMLSVPVMVYFHRHPRRDEEPRFESAELPPAVVLLENHENALVDWQEQGWFS